MLASRNILVDERPLEERIRNRNIQLSMAR